MTSHPLTRALSSICQTIGRYAWWLGLTLVLGVAAVGAYRSASVSTASAPVVRSTQATPLNPVLQSVFDYLRIHSRDQSRHTPTGPRDPATQSTLDYVGAHERVDRPYRAPALWNQAMQTVRDYLWAYSK